VEILKMIKLVLQKEGFQSLETCTTGKEAIQLVESTKYDLIILDVMLPDMYGYEICSTIRKKSNAPSKGSNETIPFFSSRERRRRSSRFRPI
jgi:DNA-binding response OmpR family regulator